MHNIELDVKEKEVFEKEYSYLINERRLAYQYFNQKNNLKRHKELLFNETDFKVYIQSSNTLR